MSENLLTTDEAAERLKVTAYTIRQHIKKYRDTEGKEGLHALKVGKAYRIPESSITNFLNQN